MIGARAKGERTIEEEEELQRLIATQGDAQSAPRYEHARQGKRSTSSIDSKVGADESTFTGHDVIGADGVDALSDVLRDRQTPWRPERVPKGIRPIGLGKKGKLGLGMVGPREYLGYDQRRDDDPNLLCAARRLAAAMHRLTVETPFVEGRAASDELARAVLTAYEIAFGSKVEDTWRAVLVRPGHVHVRPYAFMPLLLQASIAEHHAVREKERHPTIATPQYVLERLRAICADFGAPPPPAWLTVPVVGWLLARYSPGGGGGPSGKLDEDAVARLLAAPRKLAEAIERFGKKNALPELADIAKEVRRLA